MRAIVFVVSAVVLGWVPGLALGQVRIASQVEDGVLLDPVNPEINSDISEGGVVVFIGGEGASRLYVASAESPPALTEIALADYDLTDASAAHVEAGWIVFNAARTVGEPNVRGIYAMPVEGGPLHVLLEGCTQFCETDDVLGPQRFYARSLALSVNGTVAFSTVISSVGLGGLYRGPVDGGVSLFQPGTSQGGFLFNTQAVAVNDAGEVAVQAEYNDPNLGLSRGIFVFGAPMQSIPEVATVLHGLDTSEQPQPSFFPGSQVGYGFADALLRADAVPYEDHPAGMPVAPTTLADTGGAFASFERASGDARFMLRASEAGPYAFEARLEDGRHGVFRGPDPEADVVLLEGDSLFGGTVQQVFLGDVNGTGQIVLRAVVEGPGGLDTVIVRVDADAPPAPPEPKPWWWVLLELLIAKWKALFS